MDSATREIQQMLVRTVIFNIIVIGVLFFYSLFATLVLGSKNDVIKTQETAIDNLVNSVAGYESDIADHLAKISQLEKLNNKYLGEVVEIESKHKELVAGIDRGDYRVYVKATCPKPTTNTHTDSSSPFGNNEGASELTGTARRNYLDFREAYSKQRHDFITLQEYVRTQCINRAH